MFYPNKTVFRCDASIKIGLGHISRCKAIAHKLNKSENILFAINYSEMSIKYLMNDFDYVLKIRNESEIKFLEKIIIKYKPSVIIIDKKYNYTKTELIRIKKYGVKIIFIDNLCDGLEVADEVIIPGAFIDDRVFSKFISPDKIKMVRKGAKYIIINQNLPEKSTLHFKTFKKKKNVSVTVGGTDPSGILFSLLPMLEEVYIDVKIELLIGEYFKSKDKLEELCKKNNNISIMQFRISALLNADIAICAFGVTLYELLYLGIPTICVAHSEENALASYELNSKFPYFINMGHINRIDSNNFIESLNKLISDKDYYNNLALNSFELIDGFGAKRIADLISNLN